MSFCAGQGQEFPVRGGILGVGFIFDENQAFDLKHISERRTTAHARVSRVLFWK
jgi:hypothetical protein